MALTDGDHWAVEGRASLAAAVLRLADEECVSEWKGAGDAWRDLDGDDEARGVGEGLKACATNARSMASKPAVA